MRPSMIKVLTLLLNTFSIWPHISKHIQTQTCVFTEEKKLNSQPNVIYYKDLTIGAAVCKFRAVEEMREIGYTGAEEVIRSQAFNEASYRCCTLLPLALYQHYLS